MTIEERLKAAEEQLAYWQQELTHAQEQVWMWRGALEALRDVIRDDRSLVEKGAEEETAG